MKRIVIIATFAGAVAACSSGGDSTNNALNAEESAGLNNAAEMLDASPDSLVANSEAPLGNGEAPAPSDTATNQAETPATNSAGY